MNDSLKELRIKICNKTSHEFACQWILVCCILHNIILPYLSPEDLQFPNVLLDQEEFSTLPDDSKGDLKRKALFYLLNEMLHENFE